MVVLKKNDKGFDTTEKRVQLKKIVKQAFSQRRKTLKNNFKKAPRYSRAPRSHGGGFGFAARGIARIHLYDVNRTPVEKH